MADLAAVDAVLARIQRTTVPRSFLAFCEWLGVALHPGQAEIARVAFDGGTPSEELGSTLFGGATTIPEAARAVIALVCGGRAGKSYVFVALRLLWGMLVRDLSPIAPGEEAAATVVAQNDRLRQQVTNYALGAVRSKPELRALMRLPRGTKPDDSCSEFALWREDAQRLVIFRGAVAARGGYGVRGCWHTDLAMDEAAFFRDSSSQINDADIFAAGSPRVLPGGQTIVASTPWAEAGLLYELWRDNFGKPSTALVAHAPTLALLDSEANRAIVARERLRDPENALREYDARFMTGGTTIFFESSTIQDAIVDEPFVPRPGDAFCAGADFGFRSDSSALVLIALRGDMVHVFDGVELRPGTEPLKPGETVATFAEKIRGKVGFVMADQHYREAIAEHLDAHDLAFAPAPTIPVDTYVRARMLLRQGRVRLHPTPFRERLVQQLREVQGRPLPGGGVSVLHRQWSRGGHGDLASALVLALWQIDGDRLAAPPPKEGTREYEDAQQDARRRAMREEATSNDWRRRYGR